MSHQTNLTESVHKLHDSNNKNGIENDDIDEEEELDPRVQVVKFNHISYFSSAVRILTVQSWKNRKKYLGLQQFLYFAIENYLSLKMFNNKTMRI